MLRGYRKILVVVGVGLAGIGITLLKTDVPPGLLQLFQTILIMYVVGNVGSTALSRRQPTGEAPEDVGLKVLDSLGAIQKGLLTLLGQKK